MIKLKGKLKVKQEKSTDKGTKRSYEAQMDLISSRTIWRTKFVLGSLLCNVFQVPEMGNVAFKGVMPSPTLHKAFPPSPFICQF